MIKDTCLFPLAAQSLLLRTPGDSRTAARLINDTPEKQASKQATKKQYTKQYYQSIKAVLKDSTRRYERVSARIA